ncbi:MAG: T9SS type A sorting domain-containing protein [Maribacter sp.]|uniref:T9SS type A sorting domain-containing protein n=1 Tax=Maribacter sp. TaxID=1897614 RepID=UPI003297CB78
MKKKLLLDGFANYQSARVRWSMLVFAFFSLFAWQNALAQDPAPEAGEIVGGPFEFCVDGTPDMVSGLSLTGDRVGSMSSWVITDDKGKILGLPPTLEAVEGVNFDGAGPGTCLIWYLRYEEGLEGLAPDLNANDLKGSFDLSNPVYVVRSETEGGTLTGGPFYFDVDGTPDMVSGISLTGKRSGSNSIWMITDDQGKILGLPPSLAAVEGVNFDGAGAGTCFIYHLRYEDGIQGLAPDMNRDDLEGCFDLSNRVEVIRTAAPHAGEIVGGPFEFCVDGTPDMVSGLSLTGDRVGSMSSWVITDDKGKILGLPPTLEAVEGVNFDGAGAGTCLIWYLRYEEGLEGLAPDLNANDLKGSFDLSNPVYVVRSETEGGTMVGGPYEFTVDEEADFISEIALTGERAGSNSTFVITDEYGTILGLPKSLGEIKGINFNEAGPGTCLIWHLRYEDGLVGLEPDLNAEELEGCYDFSNALTVIRAEPEVVVGGEITGGPFEFCVGDDEADNVSGVAVTGNEGSNSQWVITDQFGKILGLPPSPEAVNFDGAGAGLCLIWHLSYADGLEGLEAGNNVAELAGNYEFSNEIEVNRFQPYAGTLVGGPFYFDVDGEVDNVSGIELKGDRSGTNSSWVITDDQGKILGLPPTIEAVEGVNFDGAGAGTCLIWYLRYEDGLEGLAPDLNANDLMGCFDLSNPIEVVRTQVPNAGEIVGGPYEFCVDGTPDMVSGLSLTGDRYGSMSSWVITDDKGKILGLPPTLEAVEGVDFDGAGAGTCLIWYLRYEEGLEGLAPDLNAHDLKGNFDLSNPVYVVRSETEAGTLVGGPFYFMVDGSPDMVSGITLTGKRSGSNSTFVVTSPEGEILGIPPSMEAVEGIDFDGAGAGTCLIWHLRYEDGLEGLEMGKNANDLMGCYDLSNYVEVVRMDAIDGGMLSGGPSFEFCVGDEEPDNVSGVSVSGNTGSNSQWVVTSPEGKILGLPPAPEAVNFDGAGSGTCLIWHLSYEEGLVGLDVGSYVADLSGAYDFSDYITVYRNQPDAGELTGGPFEFNVDGEADYVSGIAITGNRSGSNSTFVVTSPEGEILGIPPSLTAVEGIDFDEAGPGICLIWHLRYEDGLEGLETGLNANDLVGCYDFSNAIEVVRAEDTTAGKSSSATVFPLPATDVLNVSLKSFGNSDVHVTMIDLGGNAISTSMKKVVDKGISLDVQSVPSGLYILNITNEEGRSVSKKVIIR